MKYVFFLLLILTVISQSSCDFYDFVKGVQNDTKKRLANEKAFVKSFSFTGNVVSKQYCKKCSIGANQYSLVIKFNTIDTIPFFGLTSYFKFKDKETLELSVNKKVYLSVIEKDLVSKTVNSNDIKVNNSMFVLLSERESEWLATE